MRTMKLSVLAIFACASVACTTTVDDEAARDEQLAECQLIQDDEERLACLEDVARGPGAAEPVNEPVQ
ncbi:hypothetical protein ACR0ST_12365 [Aliidiomarina sp. Khilg15.8]